MCPAFLPEIRVDSRDGSFFWDELVFGFDQVAIRHIIDGFAVVGYEAPVLKFIHEARIVC